MKILHVITSLQTGGAEKLMVDLLPRFNAQGVQADLLLLDGTETPFKQQLRDAGVKIYELGRGSVYNPMHIIRLIPYLRKYDVVHTHNTAPQLFAAIGSVLCSVVLVTTEHNTTNRRRNWSWYAPIDRWMYRRYRKVVCISDKAEDNIRECLGNGKYDISTIYNGVDVGKYSEAEPIMEPSDTQRRIVKVAGFRYQKDHSTVIRALAMLPSRYHLYLVGDGELKEDCVRLSQEVGVSDRCHFLGVRMDVPQILKSADFVVMSSHWEGLSLSSIEGMSVGRPFIASDVDGLHEMVAGAGILFPHQDCKALADIILHLDSAPAYYQRVADACYAKAKQFDISVMVDNYLKLYESL
ncbi:MAG: glycosyltransferase [Alistipes sp.]|nr:glycosyltransferase [Alistipes sp.]